MPVAIGPIIWLSLCLAMVTLYRLANGPGKEVGMIAALAAREHGSFGYGKGSIFSSRTAYSRQPDEHSQKNSP
jgi:hypothetical protein